jgi:hypothetical protein
LVGKLIAALIWPTVPHSAADELFSKIGGN